MEKRIIQKDGIKIAVINSQIPVITDTGSALDFIASINYNDRCYGIVINKESICEDFFILSTGIAGEILQKFITYSEKIAIFGDFSVYNSKPLKDFIYESNKGKDIFFVKNEQTGIEKLFEAFK